MKTAILFPGQGAQYVGMGKDLYDNSQVAKEIFDKAAKILTWDIKEVCFEDQHAIINDTRYTQAALFTTNYATWKVLQEKGLQADAALGFSLGEYDAIAASGALDFETTLQLVEKRAIYMRECAEEHPGGMVAVIGLDIDKINEVCKSVSEYLKEVVQVANDNGPGQVTVAGTEKALLKATELLKEKGARRVIPLKVSGAFHSALMKPAALKLKEEAEKLHFKPVDFPIISNVTAQGITEKEVLKYIPDQIVNGVRFRESILNLKEAGFDTFIEVGPKTTLSNLVKKIVSDVTILNVEKMDDINQLMERMAK